MANKQTISSLVTGGEASAGPPLGPALGPMGVNILEIINAINEHTKEFQGMKIPVSVSVDSDTKKWEIEVGIPSASALLLKEAGIQNTETFVELQKTDKDLTFLTTNSKN